MNSGDLGIRVNTMIGEQISKADARRLLDPEDLGRTVNEATRDEARAVLGIPPVLPQEEKHSHYFRVWNGLKLDIYRLLSLFNVECPNAQHVAKKAICAGQRGHKGLREDWTDIRDTAIRRLEMLDEDEALLTKGK